MGSRDRRGNCSTGVGRHEADHQERTVPGRVEPIGVDGCFGEDGRDLGIALLQEVRRLHPVELIRSVVADLEDVRPDGHVVGELDPGQIHFHAATGLQIEHPDHVDVGDPQDRHPPCRRWDDRELSRRRASGSLPEDRGEHQPRRPAGTGPVPLSRYATARSRARPPACPSRTPAPGSAAGSDTSARRGRPPGPPRAGSPPPRCRGSAGPCRRRCG